MSDFILNPADEFIPDPIWLIDMLRNDLKQLDQMDGAPEEDVQLYEWTLALIGLLFPDAVWYALEAFSRSFFSAYERGKNIRPAASAGGTDRRDAEHPGGCVAETPKRGGAAADCPADRTREEMAGAVRIQSGSASPPRRNRPRWSRPRQRMSRRLSNGSRGPPRRPTVR